MLGVGMPIVANAQRHFFIVFSVIMLNVIMLIVLGSVSQNLLRT
jgi:hypothetical protein